MARITRRTMLGGLGALAGTPAQAAGAGLVTLTFLHFNDVYRHGPADGYGGLAELDTLLTQEAARATGPVFRTFGGDVLSPSLTSSVTHGAHMIELLNALGIEVAVLGNHEFDFGSDVATQRIGESSFPWLGANVLGADGQPFGGAVATTMREVDGIRVGFVGVLTRETARLNPRATGVTFTDEEAALRAGAAGLRAAGADIVVAMTHLLLADDVRMARVVPGIDLVLGGHDHEPAELQNRPGVPVLKSASDGRTLAVAELRITRPAPGTPTKVHAVAWRMLPNVDVDPSPRIVPLIAAIDGRIDGILMQPLTRLDASLDSRTTVVRTQEAALGDVVADALRAYFSADVALMNGGGLRSDHVYPAGHLLTRRDLVAEMPFGNVVQELEVTGAVLLAALENGLSGLDQRAGRFPQVSGMRFTFDPAAPPGHRLGAVTVGGQALDPDRRYTLATTDYLASGGDGYAMLRSARVVVDASGGPLLVNVAAEYVAAATNLKVGTDGRVERRG